MRDETSSEVRESLTGSALRGSHLPLAERRGVFFEADQNPFDVEITESH